MEPTPSNNNACVKFVGLLCYMCASLVMAYIGGVIYSANEAVANFPRGIAFANLGVVHSGIGGLGSSSEITGVPIVNATNSELLIGRDFVIFFPPPPAKLNLKSESVVRQWENLTVSAQNGVSVFFDYGTKSAWTAPVDKNWAIVLIFLGYLPFVSIYFVVVFTCLVRFYRGGDLFGRPAPAVVHDITLAPLAPLAPICV